MLNSHTVLAFFLFFKKISVDANQERDEIYKSAEIVGIHLL